MLVEFRVKNFRSLRDEAVFNLVASRDETNEAGSVKATGNKSVPRLLCAAAIYGANVPDATWVVTELLPDSGEVESSLIELANQGLPGFTYPTPDGWKIFPPLHQL